MINTQRQVLKVSEKLANCRKHGFYLNCQKCGYTHKVAIACKLRICPLDQSFLAMRTNETISRVVALMKNPAFLTLTAPPESFFLQDGLKQMRKYAHLLFRKLKRLNYPLGNWVMVYEVSKNESRYNHHLHLILDTKFIPQPLISKLAAETGLGKIVYITRLTKAGAVGYLSKYVSKGNSITVLEYVKAFMRKRWFSTSLDKKDITRTRLSKCPSCNSSGTLLFTALWTSDLNYFVNSAPTGTYLDP